jgi:hypothetical protein
VHRIPAGVDIKRFSPADDRAAVRSETGIARESVLLCSYPSGVVKRSR